MIFLWGRAGGVRITIRVELGILYNLMYAGVSHCDDPEIVTHRQHCFRGIGSETVENLYV